MIFTAALLMSNLALSNAFSARMAPSTRLVGPQRSSLARTSLTMASTVAPHGGSLVSTMAASEDAKKAAIAACDFEVELTERQLCDVELLMQGGFSPLTGFMDEDNYLSVVNDMKLSSGLLFGLPVVYDTDDARIQPGKTMLMKYKGVDIATMEVTSRFKAQKPLEAKNCYGTSSLEHPGTLMIATERGADYCGGKITGLNVPKRDFPCKSPQEVRDMLPADTDVVAFQCRNPIHRAHYELFTRALDAPEVCKDTSVVLVHPRVDPPKRTISPAPCATRPTKSSRRRSRTTVSSGPTSLTPCIWRAPARPSST